MTDHELEKFEEQLRRSKPAKPPEEFTTRLLAAAPRKESPMESASPAVSISDYLRMLRLSMRWFIPATAIALVAVVVWRGNLSSTRGPAGLAQDPGATDPGPAALTANDVKIDQQLVSSFDAVAKLPSGEPVRFRCENWMDQVVLSDKSRGLIVENRQPRFEVVALGFETY